MKEYICVVTSELASYKDDYISSVTFHNSFQDACEYGAKYCESLHAYPAAADYFVYHLVVGSI